MDIQTLRELYAKYRSNTLNPAEREIFYTLLEDPSQENLLNEVIDEDWSAIREEELQDVTEQRADEIFNRMAGAKPERATRPLWPRIAVAACMLIGISVGGYFYLHQTTNQQNTQLVQNDIKPGHNQATLTLANGRKIILTKGMSGQLAVQNSTTINATQNTITYNATQSGDQFSYNTMTTARGEQSPYPLVLPDGTKVWLNAESSITFPTAFHGKERIVKVTGEAFFEVAHNAKQPFKVQTEKQIIEDIGTTFDVNAYTNEPNTKTTLIEGSVKVNNIILKPGEQTDGQHVIPANTAQAVAWKDGKFRFIDDNIQTVMRQLARWYDIDVSYDGTATTEGFNAKISRNQNISVILSALERTNGVHFKIEGRRVTVIR